MTREVTEAVCREEHRLLAAKSAQTREKVYSDRIGCGLKGCEVARRTVLGLRIQVRAGLIEK